MRDLVFGLLDCSVVLFFVLPFFGQRGGEAVAGVPLLMLTGIAQYLQAAYWIAVAGMAVMGILLLVLQNCRGMFWLQHKYKMTFCVNAANVLLFVISLQPYAAAFLFLFLIMKVFLMVKWQ